MTDYVLHQVVVVVCFPLHVLGYAFVEVILGHGWLDLVFALGLNVWAIGSATSQTMEKH